MRRQRHIAHENHERWLVSYADFITLLFAFFVVMFASSQADKDKAKQVSASVKEAFSQGHLGSAVSSLMHGTVDGREQGTTARKSLGGEDPQKSSPPKTVELQASLEHLTRELQQEIKSGHVRVSLEPRGLTVSMREAAVFPSAQDAVLEGAHATIGKVAGALLKLPNPIRLEGHTDDRPIRSARFRNNWDLSSARSVAVLTILHDEFRVPLNRLSVAGYAETAPVEPNDSEEGRSRNRRVDIVVLSQQAVMAEPLTAR